MPLYKHLQASTRCCNAWLLNPATETLEVLKLEVDKWLVEAVHTGHVQVRAEPFEAIELDLSGLWGETPE